jgi:hypothetical protein
VMGIWPPDSDGTDINSLDRSPQGDLLLTADDSGKVCAGTYLYAESQLGVFSQACDTAAAVIYCKCGCTYALTVACLIHTFLPCMQLWVACDCLLQTGLLKVRAVSCGRQVLLVQACGAKTGPVKV